MNKSRIFLYFLLSFVVGVGIGSFLFLSQVLSLMFFSLGALSVILFWRKNWPGVVAGFCLIFFIFGIWKIETARLSHGVLSEFAENLLINNAGKINVTLTGYVADEPQYEDNSQKLVLQIKEYSVPRYANTTNEKVLVTINYDRRYEYGELLSVTGTLQVPEEREGEFSYKSYLAKDGIYTLLYAKEIKSADLDLSWAEKVKVRLFGAIFKAKYAFEKSVEHSLGRPHAGFVSGILFGSKAQVSDQLKESFSRTSMTHVLAISGYNIAVVAEIVSMFLLLFFRRGIAFWFALAAILIFTVMTGAQSSVVRAAIMGILILLARKEGRLYSVTNALVFVAALMVYLNPMVLRFDIGFQLSFAATIGIIFLSPKIEKKLERLPGKFNIKETLIMSLAAQIMVLPLILYYFKNLSLVSLPANLLILPTIPYAMLLGFITGLAGLISPFLGILVGYSEWLLVGIQLKLIMLLAKPGFAAISVSFHWAWMLASYAIIAALFFWQRFKLAVNFILQKWVR